MDTLAASTSANNQHHPPFTATGTVEVPVFYPTIQEMRDFPALINKIEQQHRAHLVCGIAKVLYMFLSEYITSVVCGIFSLRSVHLSYCGISNLISHDVKRFSPISRKKILYFIYLIPNP